MGVNTAYADIGFEFTDPPADPIELFREWFRRAGERGVREPGAVALATVAANGCPSSRMIQTLEITDRGLVFTSHAGSQKGREIRQTGWASGVLYWRETNQQIILGGRVEVLPEGRADELWADRPLEAHAMSIATRQSAPLDDEAALLAEAERLAAGGGPLPRPAFWVAYELIPSTVEFWQSSPDRLYRRLRYDRGADGWTHLRLQP